MEKAGGKYIPRIYLTETTGAVLGANFMQDHDVFFDAENERLGFARANCAYQHGPTPPAPAVPPAVPHFVNLTANLSAMAPRASYADATFAEAQPSARAQPAILAISASILGLGLVAAHLHRKRAKTPQTAEY